MLSLRKINPMVRAVGTMGAVAAIAGGITFAALQSNAVALSPNQLTTASASLAITSDPSCATGQTTVTPGLTGTLSSSTPVTKAFCLVNNGNVPLDMFAIIPDVLTSSTAAGATSLTINCPGIGTTGPATLTSWNSYQHFGSGTLAAGAAVSCTASASLSPSYGGSGNETIPAFTINFVGNEVVPAA